MNVRFWTVLVLCLVGAALPWIPAVKRAEEPTIDARFRLRGPLPERAKIVVVAVDNRTEESWRAIPKAMWSAELAKIVDRLSAAGAKAIGLDFVVSADPDNYLSSKGIDEMPNADLDRAILESSAPTFLGSSRAGDVVALLDVPDRLASVNNLSGIESGVVRQVPRYDATFEPPLVGLATALSGLKPKRTDPIDINFSGALPTVLSGKDVIEGRFSADVVKGAIVLVGETFDGTTDLHQTPFVQRLPGVFVHGDAVATLLKGDELRIWPIWTVSVFAGVVALLGALLALRVGAGQYLLYSLAGVAIWTTATYFSFAMLQIVLPYMVLAGLWLVLVPGVVYTLRSVEERRERLWARSVWGQLVGDSTLRRLEENRKSGLGAWDNFECCVLFLDVAGFTAMTRRFGSSRFEVVRVLNLLFSRIIKDIEEHGGEVLNFLGDGLCAKWEIEGAGSRAEAHQRALQCSLQILETIDTMNANAEFGDTPLNVRIGLSAGEVTLALIGSDTRQQMTLYGDAVNLAARLEAAGKDESVRSRLVMSEDYNDVVPRAPATFQSISLSPKGWEEAVQGWKLIEGAATK